MDDGMYIAVFDLPTKQEISVGKLGGFEFAAGIYLYVGSAQKNIESRLRRHGSRTKTLRWHVDYLSAKAEMLGAITLPGLSDSECRIADHLAAKYERSIPHFGASDCNCGGHLIYAGQKMRDTHFDAIAKQILTKLDGF